MISGVHVSEEFVSELSGDASGVDRWVGAGGSTAADVESAVDESWSAAVAGREPGLVIVFCSTAYSLADVAAAVQARAGGAPVIGCSTSGEVATAGPSESGLALWALGGEGFDVRTGAGQGSPDGLRSAAAEAAACIEGVPDALTSVLVLLADGLCGDQMEVVRGAYGVAGAAVPLVGGCAGDDLAMQQTEQLHGDRVLHNAVVAAAIGSNAPVGIGVAHGWATVGEPMLVTGSEGVTVVSLDDRPALDAYLDGYGAPADVRDDAEQFVRFAMVRPLGIKRRDRTEIRYVAGADFEQRTLTCIAEVPQGAAAHLMQGDAETVLSATDEACRAALDALDGRPPIGMLLFDCVARRSVLEDTGIRKEVDRLSAASGGKPVAGFYTYGEIARTKGAGGFHNQTLVVVAFA